MNDSSESYDRDKINKMYRGGGRNLKKLDNYKKKDACSL